MNRNQLFLLLVALAVLGGAGVVLLQHNQKSWTESEAAIGQKLFKNYQINDAAVIHIKGESELTLERKDDGWHVRERGNYPANVGQIRDLLIKMGDLKVAQSDSIAPSQLARMHLAEPGRGTNSAVLLELKDSQGKTLEAMLLGKKHVHEYEHRSPSPYGDQGFADGRYVMLAGDTKTVLTISEPLNNVEPKSGDWLNKDFFKVEKPRMISFTSTNATNSWKVTRESESAPWVLADVKAGEAFDSNKVSSLASTLSYPSFVDVDTDAAPDKTGLDHPNIVTIETFDHFTYTLKIGQKTPENDYNIHVAVSADIPATRTAGKDEKAEDKAKLDKEFQDKTKQLQDRLKQEQGLGKWTYVVNTWLLDPLLRDRAQLMVDKKTEEKSAAGNAMPPTAEPDTIPLLPTEPTGSP
jgi:hypothetical protein